MERGRKRNIQYSSRRIWRAVENSRDGYPKLLMARSNKGSEMIHRRI